MEMMKNRYTQRFPTPAQHEEQRKRRYNAIEWLEALRNKNPELLSLYAERYGKCEEKQENG
jgi:hypothetical protein